jgi:hypothetical protein
MAAGAGRSAPTAGEKAETAVYRAVDMDRKARKTGLFFGFDSLCS